MISCQYQDTIDLINWNEDEYYFQKNICTNLDYERMYNQFDLIFLGWNEGLK